MSGDLSTTNIWLAILAVVAVIQLMGTLAAVVYLTRAVKRATTVMEMAEHEIRPLAAKSALVLDDLHALSDGLQKTDASVRRLVDQVDDQVHRVRGFVSRSLWPVSGAASAVRAVVSALKSPSRPERRFGVR